MPGSIVMQQQDSVMISVAHITTIESTWRCHWSGGLPGTIMDVQGLCRTDSAPHWLESWHHLYPVAVWTTALGRVGPTPHSDSTVELALMAKVWVSQPRGDESRRARPTPYRLQHLGKWVLCFDRVAQWS